MLTSLKKSRKRQRAAPGKQSKKQVQPNRSAKSCANPHMVKVGFHDPEVGNSAPPVTYTFLTPCGR